MRRRSVCLLALLVILLCKLCLPVRRGRVRRRRWLVGLKMLARSNCAAQGSFDAWVAEEGLHYCRLPGRLPLVLRYQRVALRWQRRQIGVCRGSAPRGNRPSDGRRRGRTRTSIAALLGRRAGSFCRLRTWPVRIRGGQGVASAVPRTSGRQSRRKRGKNRGWGPPAEAC